MEADEGWTEVGVQEVVVIPDITPTTVDPLPPSPCDPVQHWDFNEDEDFRVDESDAVDDGFGLFSPVHEVLATAVLACISSAGLTGSRLALQDGYESELLTQALAEMKTTASYEARGFVLQRIDAAIQRAVSEDPLHKRAKMLGHSLGARRAWDVIDATLTGGKSSSSISTAPLPRQLLLPCKGRRFLSGSCSVPVLTDGERSAKDLLRMEQCQTRLVELLMETETPSTILARTTTNPMRALGNLVGKMRPSTMEGYLKRWYALRAWLITGFGIVWAVTVNPLLDYFSMLQDQPCRPSTPQSVYQALIWMYRIAGYGGADNPIENPLLVKAIERLTVHVGSNALVVFQAVRFPIVVLAALELMVTSVCYPKMLRIQAGSLLFRAWGTLRLDDLQRMRRRTIRLVGSMVQTDLLSTKTSGPGKRVKQLPVAISLEGDLLGLHWLVTFLDLIQTHLPRDTDYLLETSTQDLERATGKMLTYAQSSARTRRALEELRVPIHTNQGWVMSANKVLPQELLTMFTEHGPRSVMPSVAIVVEQDKDKRDMLGRWRPTASDEYSRTHREVVCGIQRKVAHSMRQVSGAVSVTEADIVDRTKRFLLERRGLSEVQASEVCTVWNSTLTDFSAHLAFVTRKQEAAEDVMLSSLLHVPMPNIVPVAESYQKARAKVCRQEQFLVCYNRAETVARLHLAAKGCYWARLELLNSQSFDVVDETMYNRRCRFCFPDLPKEDSGSSGEDSGDSDT